ncbi:SMP-30/gluconolactonase/LRE family protein [Tenacibaculum sp. SG-28]|uniref:SMP-30/gluconolactonase/LRE family protein n=1 Tax=Tenacibaculum sp. SG-28 TaxID=754426 RepID=UPI0035119E78
MWEKQYHVCGRLYQSCHFKDCHASKVISIFAKDSTANQPNDIAIAPNGIIYASDPNWKNNTGNLWRVTEEKGFELIESNMGTTNGICVSPDGKKLYVNESIQRKVWVYDLLSNGDVANKKEFTSFSDFGLDGMRCDANGNVFITRFGKGTVVVLSPKGDVLYEIELIGQKPSNITFSNTYDTCYVTMADRGCIEIVYLQ